MTKKVLCGKTIIKEGSSCNSHFSESISKKVEKASSKLANKKDLYYTEEVDKEKEETQ